MVPTQMSSLTFKMEDDKGIIFSHDEPLVVYLQVSNTMVHEEARLYVTIPPTGQ